MGGGVAVILGVLAFLLAAVFRARRRWPRARVDGTDVYVSHCFGPALVGVIRPDIVLPEWVLGLDPGARSAVIRHEAEHARARDHLALLYAGLVLAAFPWSPAIWWMCRRLRAAVEIDCDQRVIASGIGVAAYGALLLDAGSRSHARWGFAPAMGHPRSMLERRLKTMTEKQMKLKRSQVVFLSGAAVLALAIACDAPAPTQIEEAGTGRWRRRWPSRIQDGMPGLRNRGNLLGGSSCRGMERLRFVEFTGRRCPIVKRDRKSPTATRHPWDSRTS